LPAASEKSREERRFARYDKDTNGTITRAEMMETRRKAFEKLDANRDARLTFEEWAVATSDRFAKADADRSGSLTAAEFATTRREARPEARCSC
jgi:Ca2+-binding EF-hand superfamily protein